MPPIDFLRNFPTRPLIDEIASEIVKDAVEAAMAEFGIEAAKQNGLSDLEARQYRRSADESRNPEERGFILKLLQSEGDEKYLGLGILAFAPWMLPLSEAGRSLNLSDLPRYLGIEFSPKSFIEGMKAYSTQIKKKRDEFEKKLEGAIQNPSLGDLGKGDLFILDEEGLNNLVGEIMAQGGKQKVRNVKVKIDDMDRLKISGEYDHWTGWHEFTAVAEYELRDGKSSGYIKKIEALGMDLTDDVKNDILNNLRNYGFEAPDGAGIRDLSWLMIPGMKWIEINRGRVILEREPSPLGPS